MRCLYCGKELALLKRLTGGGEFCSDAHKQSYQEEYNRLALSRLLQAQAKGGEAKNAQRAAGEPGKAAPPAAPVAVEEPAPEAVPQEAEIDLQVPECAGFQIEKPAPEELEEAQPYVEPSACEAHAPLMPAWYARNGHSTLPSADLIPLKFDGDAREQKPAPQPPPVATDLTPKEITPAKVDWTMPYSGTASHEFPIADLIPMDFAAKTREPVANRPFPPAEFQTHVAAGRSELLSLPLTTIAFSEDGAVNIGDGWFDQHIAEAAPSGPSSAPVEVQPWSEPEPTPRASLEALSRLHQDLRQQEETPEPAFPEPAVSSGPVQVSVMPAEEPALAAAATQPAFEAVAVAEIAVEPQPEYSHPEPASEPQAWEAGELIEIPLLKSYANSKATVLVEPAAGNRNGSDLQLPRLKALPLRPKVGLAPPGAGSLGRASKSPVTEAKIKSAPAVPAPSQKGTGKPVAGKTAPAAGSVAPPKANAPEAAARPTPAPAPKPAPAPPTPAAAQPAARAAKPAPGESPRPPAPAESKPARRDEPQPPVTFESIELQLMTAGNGPGFWGSIKMKLSIAAGVVVLGILAYNYLGGKSHKPQPTDDTPGPSIMMGEGGWVQNWAGDPANVHAGREITIYRPSLKLTDYRIDFQGQIDSKSIGWVFRAADSNNYYVMKLAMLGTALPLKVALFKYIVLNGRENEAGRVPLDIPVSRDTVYTVRVDVRGHKFNTYIQGQPVDVWTDDQLKVGGVGFLNERTERARIKTVSISYLTGGSK